MIRYLKMQNFRQHRALEIDFTESLNVIRGANESGKSTVLEAVGYLLFGAGGLRGSLTDVVTYDEPVGSLKVEGVVHIDGVDYNVKRGKSGAEINYEGGNVTGQTEVTSFFERLLGTTTKQAMNLWWASQKSIGGALQKGSKEASQLIEELADFDLIDDVISAVQTHLTTGSTGPAEGRLKQALEHLETLSSDVEQPDPETPAKLDALKKAAAQLAEALVKAKAEDAALVETLRPILRAQDRLETCERTLVKLQADLVNTEAAIEACSVPEYDAKAHEAAVKHNDAVKLKIAEAARVKQAWNYYQALPPLTDTIWEGDRESFRVFSGEAAALALELRSDLSNLQTRVASLKREAKEPQTKCPTCGADLSDAERLKEHQAKVLVDLAEAEGARAKVDDEYAEALEQQTAVNLITKLDRERAQIAARIEPYVELDESTVPPGITWIGDPPGGDAEPLIDVAPFEQARDGVAKAEGRLEELRKSLNTTRALIESNQVQTAQERDAAQGLDDLLKKSTDLSEAVQQIEAQLESASNAHYGAVQAAAMIQKIWDNHQRAHKAAEDMLSAAKKDLESLNFNNALLKKVRAARPVIVDRLWSAVLAAVSYYFTQMRGTDSILERVDGEFLVNGRGIGDLSGSALDILGLAIRIALLKTFVPNASMFVLDEPAAACDDAREASLIGAVTQAKFSQVLFITHSDVADASATNLVQL